MNKALERVILRLASPSGSNAVSSEDKLSLVEKAYLRMGEIRLSDDERLALVALFESPETGKRLEHWPSNPIGGVWRMCSGSRVVVGRFDIDEDEEVLFHPVGAFQPYSSADIRAGTYFEMVE